MKQQTAIQTREQASTLVKRRLPQHTAVHAAAEHVRTPNASLETRFGHDFSQAAVRPSAPMVGQNYATAACPVFPRRPAPVHAKLKVAQPGDEYEQKADRMANLVMRMPDSQLQRQVVSEKDGEEDRIQTKPVAAQIIPLIQRQAESEGEEEEYIQAKQTGEQTPHISPGLEVQFRSIRGSGRPLSQSARNFFEPRFGRDLSQVRVHDSPEAARMATDLNAWAFAIGQNLVFGSGQYAPDTETGKRLLAHELTHVMQYTGGGARIQRKERRRSNVTPETRWAREHPEGRVEKLSPNHYVLWNFSVGQSTLKSEFKKTLGEIGSRWPYLNLAGTGKIVVEGHASSSGTERVNRRLALRRAIKVKTYLFGLDENIPRDRITVATFGESAPRFPNVNAAAMARNRRVEIKLLAPYSPTPRPEKEEPEKPKKPIPKESLLKDAWLGVGESHSGDLFVIGAHSAACIVYNLGDRWPNVRWAAVNVSGYKFGPGLGGTIGAAFVLVNRVSSVSEFSSLTPGGFDFDVSLGAKLKGWLSSLKGVGKVVKTLDDYKKLKYVGEQAIKNRDLAEKGLHAFAIPMAGYGLHLWLGYKFGEVQIISHGVLGGKR